MVIVVLSMFTLHIKLGAHHGDAHLLIFSRCVCDVYSAEVSENDEPQPWLREPESDAAFDVCSKTTVCSDC